MAQEPSAVEQAVSRALRDNLERIQRGSDELHQAVGDVVSACASSKPTNALPPMLRAQTAAASLSAALEVMTRFVAASLQGGQRSAFENEVARIASTVAVAEAAPVPPQVHAVEAPASAAAAEMQHEIQAEVHTEPLELAEPAPAPHVA